MRRRSDFGIILLLLSLLYTKYYEIVIIIRHTHTLSFGCCSCTLPLTGTRCLSNTQERTHHPRVPSLRLRFCGRPYPLSSSSPRRLRSRERPGIRGTTRIYYSHYCAPENRKPKHTAYTIIHPRSVQAYTRPFTVVL